MRFRFQINGNVDFVSDVTIRDVTDFLSDQFPNNRIKLTGISAHEMIEKKDNGKRRRGHE